MIRSAATPAPMRSRQRFPVSASGGRSRYAGGSSASAWAGRRTGSRPRARGRWRSGTGKISFDALDRGIERSTLCLHVGLRQRGILDPKLIDQRLAGAIVEYTPLLGGVGVKRSRPRGQSKDSSQPFVQSAFILWLQLSICICGRTSGGLPISGSAGHRECRLCSTAG